MKKNIISELFNALFKNERQFTLEERLLQSSMIIGALFGIVATFTGMLISISAVLLIAGVFFIIFQLIIFYFVRYRRIFRPLVIPALLIYLAGFIILWFYGGGIDSQNLLIAAVLLILSLAIVSDRGKKYVISVFILLIIIFFGLQYFFPKMIKGYSSDEQRWIDSILTAIYSSFFIFLLIRYLLRNYNIEKERAESARRQLEMLNADKDRFLSVLSHDLKGPFSSLLGLSSILKRKADEYDREQIKEYVSYIDESANRTYRLLDDLLTWSSSQQGKIDVAHKSLNVRDILINCLSTVTSDGGAKDIKFLVECDPGIMISADAELLKIILRNLVSNSVKFTNRGGEVRLNALQKGNETIISVSDTGTGMSSDTLSKLFNIKEFHSTKGTEEETGTGLGLLICKDYTEKQGGRIWVESVEGIGTTVFLALPKAASNAQHRATGGI